jgi:hypothetical protein
MAKQLPNIILVALAMATVITGCAIHAVPAIVAGCVVGALGLLGYIVTA